MSDELPQGWARAIIGDVADGMKNGLYRPASSYADDGVACLRMYNIDAGRIVWKNIKRMKLTPQEVNEYRLLPGDLLVNRVNSRELVGKAGVIPSDIETCVFESKNIRLRLRRDAVCPEFVNYKLLISGSQYFIHNAQQVVGMASISQPQLAAFELPLPPLAEQRRIVTKLEKLLGQADACQQRLAKIPVLLKRFRQSVLAAACSGRLTADWREEHSVVENARSLFAKIQTERKRRYEEECKVAIAAGKRKPKHPDSNERSRNLVNDLPEIPETWGYFRLEELCHQITDGTHKTPTYQTAGVPFFSVKNVRPFIVRDDDIKFISEAEHRLLNLRCNPEKGDILYTKVGTFGYAAANKLDYPFSIFVSVSLLKPVTPFFLSAFAELVMNSKVVFGQARERVSGIGTPDLHLVEIRDFRVPLPPLTEQQEIVRRVEKFFALADRLEARFMEGRKRVDSITQSVLAKAFRGELVPTEYELAKAEGRSFESAEELLERIKGNGGPERKSTKNKGLR